MLLGAIVRGKQMANGPDQHRLCKDHGPFVVAWGQTTSCPVCGELCPSDPAHTPRNKGFHILGAETGVGYWSNALGREVGSKAEEEKIMNANGYIREGDLPQHFWEDETNRRREIIRKQEDEVQQLQLHIENGSTMEEAIQKTFTAERCLSGELDDIYEHVVDFSIPKENI